MRELEEEIEAQAVGKEHRRKLKELMNKKELVGDLFNNLRLTRQRLNNSARANSSTIQTPINGSSSATVSNSSSGSTEQPGDSWQVRSLLTPSMADSGRVLTCKRVTSCICLANMPKPTSTFPRSTHITSVKFG